jgi:hypothetical protein
MQGQFKNISLFSNFELQFSFDRNLQNKTKQKHFLFFFSFATIYLESERNKAMGGWEELWKAGPCPAKQLSFGSDTFILT